MTRTAIMQSMSPTPATIVIPYAASEQTSSMEGVPMVDVTLLGAMNVGPTPGLVDSGAERTSIPIEWAELLGFDRAACREVRVHNVTVTRRAWVPPGPVGAIVAGHHVQLIPIFSDVRDFLVLGRDLFLHFIVEFDERARELRLTPYPERVGLKERAWD